MMAPAESKWVAVAHQCEVYAEEARTSAPRTPADVCRTCPKRASCEQVECLKPPAAVTSRTRRH